jgi:hypothetical protein
VIGTGVVLAFCVGVVVGGVSLGVGFLISAWFHGRI